MRDGRAVHVFAPLSASVPLCFLPICWHDMPRLKTLCGCAYLSSLYLLPSTHTRAFAHTQTGAGDSTRARGAYAFVRARARAHRARSRRRCAFPVTTLPYPLILYFAAPAARAAFCRVALCARARTNADNAKNETKEQEGRKNGSGLGGSVAGVAGNFETGMTSCLFVVGSLTAGVHFCVLSSLYMCGVSLYTPPTCSHLFLLPILLPTPTTARRQVGSSLSTSVNHT